MLAHLSFALSVAFLLSSIAAPAWAVEDASAPSTERILQSEERKIPALEKWESLRILYYKPIYFAYAAPSTKVQASFRAPVSERVPFNFAFTQIIFWNLHGESKPFLDATYNPEFFYRHKLPNSDLQSLDFGVWEHNSNGKSGAVSRSFDQTYVRANFAFEGPRWITQMSVKLRYLYNFDDTNSDLRDYVSPIEFQFRWLQLYNAYFDESEISLTLTPGGKFADRWTRGGYLVGIATRPGGLRIIPAFYAQYYHGYAETLVNYTQSIDQFRVGLLF